jgi:hypothetical protein
MCGLRLAGSTRSKLKILERLDESSLGPLADSRKNTVGGPGGYLRSRHVVTIAFHVSRLVARASLTRSQAQGIADMLSLLSN